MSAVCPGGRRDGPQQDDGVLMDEAQESRGNNLDCGWIPGGRRLSFESGAMVEQGVVAAKPARYSGFAISAWVCLDRNRKVFEAAKRSN